MKTKLKNWGKIKNGSLLLIEKNSIWFKWKTYPIRTEDDGRTSFNPGKRSIYFETVKEE